MVDFFILCSILYTRTTEECIIMNNYYVEKYGDGFVIINLFGDIVSYYQSYDEAQKIADCMNNLYLMF